MEQESEGRNALQHSPKDPKDLSTIISMSKTTMLSPSFQSHHKGVTPCPCASQSLRSTSPGAWPPPQAGPDRSRPTRVARGSRRAVVSGRAPRAWKGVRTGSEGPRAPEVQFHGNVSGKILSLRRVFKRLCDPSTYPVSEAVDPRTPGTPRGWGFPRLRPLVGGVCKLLTAGRALPVTSGSWPWGLCRGQDQEPQLSRCFSCCVSV